MVVIGQSALGYEMQCNSCGQPLRGTIEGKDLYEVLDDPDDLFRHAEGWITQTPAGTGADYCPDCTTECAPCAGRGCTACDGQGRTVMTGAAA